MKMKSHLPPQCFIGKKINGIDAVDFGSEPILWTLEVYVGLDLKRGGCRERYDGYLLDFC